MTSNFKVPHESLWSSILGALSLLFFSNLLLYSIPRRPQRDAESCIHHIAYRPIRSCTLYRWISAAGCLLEWKEYDVEDKDTQSTDLQQLYSVGYLRHYWGRKNRWAFRICKALVCFDFLSSLIQFGKERSTRNALSAFGGEQKANRRQNYL